MAAKKNDNSTHSGGPGAIGMLACCLVVVAGCWMKLSPETILTRAIVSGIAITVLFRVVGAVMRHTMMDED